MDEETWNCFDEDLYVYGNIMNDENQLNNKVLSKICEIDHDGYRYYVFSQSLLRTDNYRYNFSDSSFNVSFLILQGKDYRALQYDYSGYLSSTVKDLKDIGVEIWYEIKQKQIELKNKIS